MPPEAALADKPEADWGRALAVLGAAWLGLFWVTFEQWAQMAHQWWNIDTYSHILLIPPIVAWLARNRMAELAKLVPVGWLPGMAGVILGLSVWLAGTWQDINLIAQAGTVFAFQSAVFAVLGLRAGLLLVFPLGYMAFLVPFGDEIIPPLQFVTAEIATALTMWSGIDTVADGILIDTPAGLFIVAEECSGVKFLVAMVALGVLVAHTCFSSWNRRAWFLLACVVVPILANGIRAWATIFIAQYIGAEAAGSFDHIVYGWVFFGLVIAMVLGVAWRWFEREPEEAGWSASELAALPFVARAEGRAVAPALVAGLVLVTALFFAVTGRVG